MINEIPDAVAEALWPFAAAFIVACYAGFTAALHAASKARHE